MRTPGSAAAPGSGHGLGWQRDPAVARVRTVEILLDGESVDAHEGESLAVALAAAGRLVLRHSPVTGGPRGMFCLMGVCQECIVHVDGAPVTACMEPVRDGMRVALDKHYREFAASAGAES